MSDADVRSGNHERALEVLDAIVRLNIETGRPVSSGLVERYLQRAVSSATIRAIMGRLERSGFLEQPHTSAGRLPTDRGYRVYVDRLRSGWALHRHEVPAGLLEAVRSGVRRSAGSQTRVKQLAGLLSSLTDSIGIIVGDSLESVRVARVECYPRHARRVLMVVIFESAAVRTTLVDLKEDTPEHVVAEACRLLQSRVQGRAPADIRRWRLPAVDLVDTPVTRCEADLARGGQVLMTAPEDGEIQLDGVSQVLAAPEFQAPEPLRSLLRFIESPRHIRDSLARLRIVDGEAFGVWIGQENPVGELRDFAVLTGRIELDGRSALAAVLGPRRMSYLKAFHGIDAMRRVLGTTGPAVS